MQRAATQQWLIRGDESNLNVSEFDSPFISSGNVSYPHCWRVSLTPNFFIAQVQKPEFALCHVFLNLNQAREGNTGRQYLMILNDLISHLINCAREAVNDFRLHFDNRTDGIKNEIGYIVIERPSRS